MCADRAKAKFARANCGGNFKVEEPKPGCADRRPLRACLPFKKETCPAWNRSLAAAAAPPDRNLLGGIAAVDQDGLSGNPPAIAYQMPDERYDIFDIGQACLAEWRECRRRLVVSHGILAFSRVKE